MRGDTLVVYSEAKLRLYREVMIMKKIISILLVSMLLITGCSQKEVRDNFIKVAPSKLFQGDALSLEPHMDMITGCVDVNYKGSKENIGLSYEIWKDGTLDTKENILSSSIQDNGFDGEISISLKDIINYNLESSELMRMKTVIRTESGYSASLKYIGRFDKEYGHSPQDLQTEINATEDEEIIIWGLAAGDVLSSGGEDIDSAVKKAKWGMIVKLYFE